MVMAESIRIGGLTVAPGVIETVMRLATETVAAVTVVGMPGLAGLAQRAIRGQYEPMVEINEEGDALILRVYVQVEYGHKLPEVAAAIRSAVADAVVSQVGVAVESVDIFVDGLTFPEE